MGVSYNRLWKLMIDKRISKTELTHMAGISTNAMAKLDATKMSGWQFWRRYALLLIVKSKTSLKFGMMTRLLPQGGAPNGS